MRRLGVYVGRRQYPGNFEQIHAALYVPGPPGPRHQPPRIPRRRTLYLMTDRGEKLRSAPPIHVVCHLEHVDVALYALRVIEAKSYGTHHLELIIGQLEHLDAALYAL